MQKSKFYHLFLCWNQILCRYQTLFLGFVLYFNFMWFMVSQVLDAMQRLHTSSTWTEKKTLKNFTVRCEVCYLLPSFVLLKHVFLNSVSQTWLIMFWNSF